MGKTICLLIAIALLAQAEYVKSLQPALQSQEKPQKTPKTTRNSRIPSDKNVSKAELNTSNAENSRTHIKPPLSNSNAPLVKVFKALPSNAKTVLNIISPFLIFNVMF